MPDLDPVVIEFTKSTGQRMRVVYESRYPRRGYTRRTQERRGCQWRTVGTDEVVELTIDGELPAPLVEGGP